MPFREVLPPNDCPPAESHQDGCETAFRFVPTAVPQADDFASHQAKGIPLPEGFDPCRWASCSLYTDLKTVQKKRKLKGLRDYGFVAELKIAEASGHMVQRADGHIDFWMFDTFDPLAAIVQVQAL